MGIFFVVVFVFLNKETKSSTHHFSDNTQLFKINYYWKGKGGRTMGLVSHECMWADAGRLSLLQKQILIFNL